MKIGNRSLVFKRIPPKELLPGTGIVILVTQALRNMGKNAVDDEVVQHLRGMLTDNDKKALLDETRHMENWLWETASSRRKGMDLQAERFSNLVIPLFLGV
jgi:hypothetical protein